MGIHNILYILTLCHLLPVTVLAKVFVPTKCVFFKMYMYQYMYIAWCINTCINLTCTYTYIHVFMNTVCLASLFVLHLPANSD